VVVKLKFKGNKGVKVMEKMMSILQWIGTALVIALQVSVNFGGPTWVSVMFSVTSAVVWTTSAIMMKNKQLVITNGACLAFGLIGVARVFG